MNSNIDHHLYAQVNVNQAMISSFGDQSPSPNQAIHQAYPNLSSNNSNQYHPPPQNFHSPDEIAYAPSFPDHQDHQNPYNQPGYPQNPHYDPHQAPNFSHNNQMGNQPKPQLRPPVQPVQHVVQHVQVPQTIVQVVHVVPPKPQVQVVIQNREDFRMLDGCYNMFKCWLLLWMVAGSLFTTFAILWQSYGGGSMQNLTYMCLMVYLLIFSKIEFDAIADRKHTKAKAAWRGFVWYLVYYWVVLGAVTKLYNSDVGSLALQTMGFLTFPIFGFLIGAYFVERKLARYEAFKKKIQVSVNVA